MLSYCVKCSTIPLDGFEAKGFTDDERTPQPIHDSGSTVQWHKPKLKIKAGSGFSYKQLLGHGSFKVDVLFEFGDITLMGTC